MKHFCTLIFTDHSDIDIITTNGLRKTIEQYSSQNNPDMAMFDTYIFGGLYGYDWHYYPFSSTGPGNPVDVCNVVLPDDYVMTPADEANFKDYLANRAKPLNITDDYMPTFEKILRMNFIREELCHAPLAFIDLDGEFNDTDDVFDYIEELQMDGPNNHFIHVLDMV